MSYLYSKSNKIEGRRMKCGCGRKIDTKDTFFIKLEPGEDVEIFCEFCVSIIY